MLTQTKVRKQFHNFNDKNPHPPVITLLGTLLFIYWLQSVVVVVFSFLYREISPPIYTFATCGRPSQLSRLIRLISALTVVGTEA